MPAVTPPSFSFGAAVTLVVHRYHRALLSVPALAGGTTLGEKDLLAVGRAPSADRFTLDEHLAYLSSSGALAADRPLLVLGMRNSLVNLRCPVIAEGRVHAVAGEVPEKSRRSYFGIGARGGRLQTGDALGDACQDWSDADFFCAGVPVLDERFESAALFDAILTEAADHSHLYQLPRGNHPLATDASRAAWAHLHDTFTAHLNSDRASAAAAMRSALETLRPEPSRCANYLHVVLGLGVAGEICCVIAHGRLESIGRRAAELGAKRAVCVENSGSAMPTFLPEGTAGPRIPLFRAPNFRPQGRALLVIELESSGFDSLGGMV